MEDAMPQDEYFEWEDIVLYRAPCEVTPARSSSSNSSTGKGWSQQRTLEYEYRRTLTRQAFEDGESSDSDDFQWSDEAGSEFTAPASTTSVQTSFTFNWTSEKKESPIDFPSYEDDIDLGLGGLEKAAPIVDAVSVSVSSSEPPTTSPPLSKIDNEKPASSDRFAISETRDCESICLQPCGNVNYLLHHWREADVSASWKYLVTKSKTWGDISRLDHSSWKRHNNVARLENASWRTWSKLRFGLRTVSPGTINWMKHCDDTCLYGPFQPGTNTSVSSSASHLLSSSSSRGIQALKCKSEAITPIPILKKPSTASLLRRGSLPTFTTGLATVQGRPLSDASPLTFLRTSCNHAEFTTPMPTLGPRSPKNKVKFLEEVRQYIIVNPIGDRKIHRTVKKTRSTTLQSDAYFLESTPAPAVQAQVAEPSYWSPDSLWSHNPEPKMQEVESKEWTWLGAVGEDDESIGADYFSSKRSIHSPPSPGSVPGLSPPASSPMAIPMGSGSLTHYNLGMHLSGSPEVDDEMDYLMSCDRLKDCSSDLVGAYSPASPDTQGSQTSEETETETDSLNDDDETSPYQSADIVDEKTKMGYGSAGLNLGRPMRAGTGIGIGIGIMDDEKHALYEQIMEEFELGY